MPVRCATTDHLLTAYRDHGWAICRGLDPKAVMAELLGKATGVTGGKGGSMHLASAERHYWGGHAIVGGHLPLATGVGLAVRYNEKHAAVLCVLGEGTTNIGYFHESVNLAAVWKLPVVFLVENNQYGMGTEVGRASAVTNIFEKGCAYDIPNKQFNGQDVFEVYETLDEALEYARTNGPVLLEAVTYRYVGHSMGDPERYRTKAEIEEWRTRDPILRLQDRLAEKGSHERRGRAEDCPSRSKTSSRRSSSFAEESPEPGDEVLCEDVYVNPIPHRIATRNLSCEDSEASMARMTVREAISQALREEMYRDERVFIMGEEIGKWGGTYAVTRGFLDEFGESRVRDTPIAEGVIVGAAVGAAMAGLRPVAEIMTINFAFLAMDQIVNHAAKIHYMFNGQIRVPLVIRTVGGGGRQLGATHSQTPDSVFAISPA